MKFLTLLSFAIMFIMQTAAQAAPGLINYQGRLTNASGQPITTTVPVTFTFWDAETGGQRVGAFTDTDQVTPDANGIYATLIGDDPDNLVPEAVFGSDRVWLNVNVAGEDLAPRLRMTSVSYSLVSGHATLADQSTTSTHAATADRATTAAYADHTRAATVALKGLQYDFPVDDGATVNAGDFVELLNNGKIRKGSGNSLGASFDFHTPVTNILSAARLTDTSFAIGYSDTSNSGRGMIVIGEVNGYSVAFGPENLFNDARTDTISVTGLDDHNFIIAYSDVNAQGYAIVANVQGNIVTFSPKIVFANGGATTIVTGRLTDSKFFIVFRDEGHLNYGTAIIGEIAGNSIGFGPKTVFRGTDSRVFSATRLTDNKLVVVYSDGGGDLLGGKAFVGEIVGSAISFGTARLFNGAEAGICAVARLTDSTFVIVFSDTGNSNYGTAIIGDASGSTISFGPKIVFNDADISRENSLSITPLTSNSFFATFFDFGNYTIISGNVQSRNISFGTKKIFNNNGLKFVSSFTLSPTQYAVYYANYGHQNGSIFLGDVETMTTHGKPLGISSVAGVENQRIPINLQGVSDVQGGLAPAQTYYANPDGVLTTATTPVRVGHAISANKILLDVTR